MKLKIKFLNHLLSWCLIFSQLSTIPKSEAQTTSSDISNIPVVTEEGDPQPDQKENFVEEANQKREENIEHNEVADQNDGTKSYCEEEESSKRSEFKSKMDNYQTFVESNQSALKDRADSLIDQKNNLNSADAEYDKAHGNFADPAKPIQDKFDTARARMREANEAYDKAKQNLTSKQQVKQYAEAELSAAKAACNNINFFCTPKEKERIRIAEKELEIANKELQTAKTQEQEARREKKAAESKYKTSPNQVLSSTPGAIGDIKANADGMNQSHAVSGCDGSFDISQNTSKTCALSGPLFEADQELNRIANAGINEAKKMAADRTQALFELELQQEYAADYKLYKMAVDGADFTEDLKKKGYDNLDQIDELKDDNENKTKNLKLLISNIKTVGTASAVVRDTFCEKHSESEADAKSAYVFKAAAATWLMAVVQDTDYFAGEVSCRSEEMITTDDNNLQIQTIERAANVKDQMLVNLCLRVNPPEPGIDWNKVSNDEKEWKKYGDTLAEAEKHVKVINGYTEGSRTYPSLKERCNKYLRELRGPEFADKPRTREAAREMMENAEALAKEELIAKNKKLVTADANIKKGEKWVKDTQNRIAIALALLAAVQAAMMMAYSQCAGCGPFCPFCCAQCGVAAQLMAYATLIAAIIIALWLKSELSRAKDFLSKWKEKYRIAQYYTHMACNFETADKEKERMRELGEKEKQKKKEEILKAERDATRKANDIVSNATGSSPGGQSSLYTPEKSKFFVKLNKEVQKSKSKKELISFFSREVFVIPVKDFKDLKSRLTRLGLDLIVKTFFNEARAAESTFSNTEGAIKSDTRNVYRDTDALNVQEGTESFRFFLKVRNKQFQYQTHDMTNQPNHKISNREKISPPGKKNMKGKLVISVEELAKMHLNGGWEKYLALVWKQFPEADETGFATPETRLAYISNIKGLFSENIELLRTTGLPEIAWQRDQIVTLLENAKDRMSNNVKGLGETEVITREAPRPVCAVGDVSDLNFDPTCGCAKKDSCGSFEVPQFNINTGNALKDRAKLSLTTANSVMRGDLKGAAINGGTLVAKSAAVRTDLFRGQKTRGIDRKKDSSRSDSSSGNSSNSFGSSNNASGEFIKNVPGVGQNGAVGDGDAGNIQARSGLNSKQNGNNSSNENEDNGDQKEGANDRYEVGAGNLNFSGSLNSAGGIGNNGNTQEDFALDTFGTNLQLESLTDEEKASLGLESNTNDKILASGNGHYGHAREVSSSRRYNHGKTFSDEINQNRNLGLFKIISKRYQDTAYPVLLDTK